MNTDDINAQYLPSLSVENPEKYLQNSARRSARVRKNMQCELGVRYGKLPRQYVDIFPAAKPDAPVHVFIHGGYWRAKHVTTAIYSHIAAPMVKAGATVVLLEYELCPDVRVTDIVEQVRDAMLWIYRRVKRYNGDNKRMFVSGHSVGGHLTAMLAATHWPNYGRYPANLIKGIAPMSGLFDIEPHRHSDLQETIRLTRKETRELSPMYLTPTFKGSAVIAVGGGEPHLFHWQSLAYAAHLRHHRLQTEFIATGEDNHFQITDRLGRATDPLTKKIIAQMGL
ncbi:MAG: alpha/beta hydrolase [Pseudomonadota bacterium]